MDDFKAQGRILRFSEQGELTLSLGYVKNLEYCTLLHSIAIKPGTLAKTCLATGRLLGIVPCALRPGSTGSSGAELCVRSSTKCSSLAVMMCCFFLPSIHFMTVYYLSSTITRASPAVLPLHVLQLLSAVSLTLANPFPLLPMSPLRRVL